MNTSVHIQPFLFIHCLVQRELWILFRPLHSFMVDPSVSFICMRTSHASILTRLFVVHKDASCFQIVATFGARLLTQLQVKRICGQFYLSNYKFTR